MRHTKTYESFTNDVFWKWSKANPKVVVKIFTSDIIKYLNNFLPFKKKKYEKNITRYHISYDDFTFLSVSWYTDTGFSIDIYNIYSYTGIRPKSYIIKENLGKLYEYMINVFEDYSKSFNKHKHYAQYKFKQENLKDIITELNNATTKEEILMRLEVEKYNI